MIMVTACDWRVAGSTPGATEDLRVERLIHVKSVESQSSRCCGVVVSRGDANSDVVLDTKMWFKIMRSVNVALYCDVNIALNCNIFKKNPGGPEVTKNSRQHGHQKGHQAANWALSPRFRRVPIESPV
ncbi:hypothetical protein TNCV_4939601 [Trichonephila clavipes]|nr:hypothetical protein TNCV_4939601 [Trichonephila clavipes]